MPLYFFHVRDGDRLIEDVDGSYLPSLAAACADASASARHLLAKGRSLGEVLDGRCFQISNSTGLILAVMPFKEAIIPR
ncbi:DUF6894 family protein [Methylobacterium sp. J-070]|uniref:DUF6894 family protein n=1 Tax=Methylobacterium sp. J-070 TaxID=2836650 RepID=UPI001FB99A42|nr:hypothetical protein [Methylobacterium sp. J-070]MCJ2052132.1 hypothetical protein [Methylobacterium sp. J-070]